MLRNTADCQADVDRFKRHVADSEKVWYLSSGSGVAFCESNSEETDEPAAVFLFFSDEAYARRVHSNHFPDYKVTSMTLFDFLYRWLPGMTEDGVLAGPNWTGDLIGLELGAFPLRQSIESMMTSDHLERYREQFDELSGA